jgi:hypothetical protein
MKDSLSFEAKTSTGFMQTADQGWVDRLDIEASIPRLAGGLWGADLSAADLRDQVFLDLDRRSRNSKLIAFVRFRIATQRA